MLKKVVIFGPEESVVTVRQRWPFLPPSFPESGGFNSRSRLTGVYRGNSQEFQGEEGFLGRFKVHLRTVSKLK